MFYHQRNIREIIIIFSKTKLHFVRLESGSLCFRRRIVLKIRKGEHETFILNTSFVCVLIKGQYKVSN